MAGNDVFRLANAPGASLVARLEISARVRATAAIASGFFCRLSIVAVAVCWRQLHSSNNRCKPVIFVRSSIWSSYVFSGTGGGSSPYARSISISSALALRVGVAGRQSIRLMSSRKDERESCESFRSGDGREGLLRSGRSSAFLSLLVYDRYGLAQCYHVYSAVCDCNLNPSFHERGARKAGADACPLGVGRDVRRQMPCTWQRVGRRPNAQRDAFTVLVALGPPMQRAREPRASSHDRTAGTRFVMMERS
ncbi:hypothetical protein KC337_g94 [Hortaea werneckii]|nr:hypothetical protein KC337_g94 [Hortaea werneckii]